MIKLRDLLKEIHNKEQFPSEYIGNKLGLNLSTKYIFPKNLDENKLAKLIKSQKGDIGKILMELIKLNPQLRILKPYLQNSYVSVIYGICSRFLPEDILFWCKDLNEMGLLNASSEYKKYFLSINESMFQKIQLNFNGWIPSPKNLELVEKSLGNK